MELNKTYQEIADELYNKKIKLGDIINKNNSVELDLIEIYFLAMYDLMSIVTAKVRLPDGTEEIAHLQYYFEAQWHTYGPYFNPDRFLTIMSAFSFGTSSSNTLALVSTPIAPTHYFLNNIIIIES